MLNVVNSANLMMIFDCVFAEFVKVYKLSNSKHIEILSSSNKNTYVMLCDDNIHHRWASLLVYVNILQDEGDVTEEEEHHIGGGWYISASADRSSVDVYKNHIAHDGTLLRTSETVTLCQAECEKLNDIHSIMCADMPTLCLDETCYHDGQLDYLRCSECSPYHYYEWW